MEVFTLVFHLTMLFKDPVITILFSRLWEQAFSVCWWSKSRDTFSFWLLVQCVDDVINVWLLSLEMKIIHRLIRWEFIFCDLDIFNVVHYINLLTTHRLNRSPYRYVSLLWWFFNCLGCKKHRLIIKRSNNCLSWALLFWLGFLVILFSWSCISQTWP